MKYLEIVKETNPIVFKIIKNAFDNQKIAHSYIFYGNKEVDIDAEPKLLMEFILTQNNFQEIENIESYSDLIFIDGSKDLIKKDNILFALNKLSQKALDHRGIKILFIKNIENANHFAINSLLKFIEEPQDKTFIIMTSNSIENVLETIKSRSQNIILRPNSKQKIYTLLLNENQIDKKFIALLSAISPSLTLAKKTYEDENFVTSYENVLLAIKQGIFNKNKFIETLYPFFKKENSQIIILLLQEFLNDIWKINTFEQISFSNQKDLLLQYQNINFNFIKGLKAINNFVNEQNLNVNFNLSKNNLLLTLKECYEVN